MTFNKSHTNHKLMRILISISVFISFFMTPLFAWEDNNQHKSNEMSGLGINKTVVLTKYARKPGGESEVLKDAEFKLYRDLDTPIQIGGIYKTNANGQIVIDDLEAGDYYFLEVKPPLGYDYDQDSLGQPIKKYEFEITATHDQYTVNVQAYNIPIETDLIIRKEIVNTDQSEVTLAQKDIDFEFKVTFNDGGTYDYSVDGGPSIPLTSGETLLLKHNQQAVFKDLPYGLKYKVVELYSGKYITATVNNEGNIGEDTIVADFKNTIEKEVYLEFSKRVENKDDTPLSADQLTALENVYFDFTVTFHRIDENDQRVEAGPFHYVIDNGTTVSNEIRVTSGEVIKLHHNETARFIDMPAGIHYKIIEDALPGYLPTIFNISGVSQIASDYDGTPSLDHRFVHQFVNLIDDQIQDGFGSLKIEKSIYGEIEPIHEQDLFTFEIIFTKRENGALVPDDTIYHYRIDGVEFGPLREQGEVKNKISIKPGQVVEVKDLPSNTEFLVIEESHPGYLAIVEEVNGIIVTDKASETHFMNVLDGDRERVGSLKVTKKVTNHTTDQKFVIYVNLDGEEHEILLAHDQSTVFEDLPIGTRYTVSEKDYGSEHCSTTIINGQGVISEGVEVDVFVTNHFTVAERLIIKGEKTWDLSADLNHELPESIEVNLLQGNDIIATQTVRPNAEGKWLYEFDVVKHDEAGCPIDYTVEEVPIAGYQSDVSGYNIKNTLKVATQLRIPIEKQVKGDIPDEQAQFVFEIIGVYQEPLPNNQQVIIEGAGTDEFDAIEFVEEGTYHYKVYELNTRQAGYDYDRTIYDITVSVISVNNHLKIDKIEMMDSENQEIVDEIIFINSFKKLDEITTPSKPDKEEPLASVEVPNTSATQTIVPYVIALVLALIVLRLVLFSDRNRKRQREEQKDE